MFGSFCGLFLQHLYNKGIDNGLLPYIKHGEILVYAVSTSVVFHAVSRYYWQKCHYTIYLHVRIQYQDYVEVRVGDTCTRICLAEYYTCAVKYE